MQSDAECVTCTYEISSDAVVRTSVLRRCQMVSTKTALCFHVSALNKALF